MEKDTFGIIGTWRMAYEGISSAYEGLQNGTLNASDAIVQAINAVEDYPFYKSVGYGGLPNEAGVLEMDAAYMNGDTFQIGAVAGVQDIKNPVTLARKLSFEKFNSMLIGAGAEKYAQQHGFERTNMLTERARKIWEKRLKEIYENNLNPYDGHDTVGMISLDTNQSMRAATSTSGLFMKKTGRVGDSPISGSGFYVDSQIGGATATGLGEDLMKGCLSYETVRLMGEGMHPQEAVNKALFDFAEKLAHRNGKAGAMSLVCMNNKGEWGVATNVEFSFVVATNELKPIIYLAYPDEKSGTTYAQATQEWLDAYQARITKPLED